MYELSSCDGSDSPCSSDNGEQNCDAEGRYCLSHSASSDDETSGADALAVVPVVAGDHAVAVH